MADKEIYISDVFDIDEVVREHGNKIFLIAGVGAGKSTWVKEVLAKKGNTLFITSRRAKVDEDTHDSVFSEYYKANETDSQVLITNAKITKILEQDSLLGKKEIDEFINHFQYIVVDEIHSMATDSVFTESSFGVQTFIEYVVKKGKIVVVMSGTPEPVEEYFKYQGWYFADYRKGCNYVHPNKITIRPKSAILGMIRKEIGVKKIVYFANRTETIVDYCKKILDSGLATEKEIAVIVSKNRVQEMEERIKKVVNAKSAKMIIDASAATYQNIIEESLIPDECKIMFSTSTLREGVDIKNTDIYMICESHLLSDLIQFFGRARLEGCAVDIVNDVAQHSISNDELLYAYALENETLAANVFVNNQVNDNPIFRISKARFIDYVRKNPYIDYNYIEERFEVLHMKWAEENRLLQEKKHSWKENLRKYCEKWEITIFDYTDATASKNILSIISKNRKKAFDKDIQEGIRNFLHNAYGIVDKQPSKINEKLEEYGADFRLETGKGTKGEERNKRYWLLVPIDKE